MHGRRKVLLAITAMVAAPIVRAAGRTKAVRVVGWLTGGSPESDAKLLEAFREGLKAHGWLEGRNLRLEARFARGKPDRVPALAGELVGLKPDVIFSGATPIHLAFKKATSTIPIVMGTGADPVAAGLVASLAHPGGNVTGMVGLLEATPIKMLELAAGLVPRGARIELLVDRSTPFASAAYREQVMHSATALGVRAEYSQVKSGEDVMRAFAALAKHPPAAIVELPSPMLWHMRREVIAATAKLGVPAVYPFAAFADAGGLMSYAASVADSYRRAAGYVDRILRGAKPGDLPVQQPTRLELVVNLETARSQGIRIPQSILLRADRVIR